jgi:formylglycine-generating enzyme required for sulfatase activity
LIALARLGKPEEFPPALRRGENEELRTRLVHDASPNRLDAAIVAGRLTTEPDPAVRAGLVLMLGEYEPSRIDPATRRDTETRLLKLYREQPDAGLHGAIAWLLRARWDNAVAIAEIDRSLQTRDPVPGRNWYVNKQGQPFAVIRGPVDFMMGEPAGEKERDDNAIAHPRRIPRSFAIATTEVTVAQYRRFVEANKAIFKEGFLLRPRVSPKDDCPVHAVSWFEAMLYCRWLSEQERIPNEEMCFPPLRELVEAFENGKKFDMSAGRFELTGYRLPSEAEWEYACRAGTTTTWFFGSNLSLLPDYAWFAGNSGVADLLEAETKGRTVPVGRRMPNGLGLFDVYGNVREWCLDAYRPYGYRPGGQKPEDGPIADTFFEDPVTVGDYTRVARGGSFAVPAGWIRSSYRNGWVADQHLLSTGFRVARTVHPH